MAKLSEDKKFIKDPIVKTDFAFSDERGSIIPWVDEDMKSAVLITSAKGTIRANHYHKTDWHYCYVIEGTIDYYHRVVGDENPPDKVRVTKGQLFFTPSMVEHAMCFAEDTTFVCLGRNPRDQASYEADIVRIDLVTEYQPD